MTTKNTSTNGVLDDDHYAVNEKLAVVQRFDQERRGRFIRGLPDIDDSDEIAKLRVELNEWRVNFDGPSTELKPPSESDNSSEGDGPSVTTDSTE